MSDRTSTSAAAPTPARAGSRVDLRIGRRVRVRVRTDASFILAVAALVVGILACVPPIIRAARGVR